MLRQLITCGGLLTVLAFAAVAENTPASSSVATVTRGKLTVVAASSLIGKSVKGSKGEKAGEIQYLMANGRTGKVSYIVVAPRDAEDYRLVALSWDTMTIAIQGNDVLVVAKNAEIKDGPYFSREQLAKLTRPLVYTEIHEYWVPVLPDRDPSRNSNTRHAPNQAGADRDQNSDSTLLRSADRQDRPIDSHMMIGQTLVKTVVAPQFAFTDQIADSAVIGIDGKELGKIDELMIDVNHGRIVYVDVSSGGFFGFGEEQVAVPYSALQHDVQDNSYRLTVGAEILKRDMSHIDAGESGIATLPMSQIQRLYIRYDAKPYWTWVD